MRGSPRRLLIVDDDEHIQRSYRRIAEAEGYEVLQAYEGLHILELVRAETPDVILLDINMPHSDGRDVLRDLKAHADTASIPVLICSSRSDQLDRHLVLELGAEDYFDKPCRAELLLMKMERILARRREAPTDAPPA